ncbi:MAG: NAD-dependent epimerase/dehydratase family protein [Saprospiraceae bacterium]
MTHPNRIFITGATGFVGATLVRHFAAQGWEVTASGRTAPPAPLLAVAKYVQADIQKPLPRQEADVVVHAAALASDSVGMAALKKTNLDGTRHVFEAARNCPCFVYISSSSVYDARKTLHEEDESVDCQKLSPYGLSKRMAEDWLLEQDWGHRSLYVLRPRAVYGVGDRVLLPRLMRLVRWGHILSPGEMRVSSSLTHVENLCAAVECCALSQLPESSKLSGSSIFNVADAQPYEMREVVHRLLSEIHGQELAFRAIPMLPLRWMANALESLQMAKQFTPYALATVAKDSVLDIQKISRTLGYLPKRNFWETLPEIASWANAVGLYRVQQANADLPWMKF